MKIAPLKAEPTTYVFMCPGCNDPHQIPTKPPRGWTFNGDMVAPTFSPSILVTWNDGENRVKHVCHSYVRAGKIQFLSDCTHKLAGQTVELADVPERWT